MGGYDLHSYEIKQNKNEVKFSLDDEDKICLWADFDNLGRLVFARGSSSEDVIESDRMRQSPSF